MRKLSTLVLIISSILMLNLQIQAQNLGIGTSSFNPDTSALVEMRGTKGLLIPRMSTAERNAIAYPAQSLLIFNTTTKCFETYVDVDGAWHAIWCSTPTPPPFPCGVSITIAHDSGSVAPVNKTVTYGTILTDLTGSNKCWITQNLGASNQASSATDTTEASAGWYWQFNRKQGYKVGPSPSWTITSISESSDWTSANDPCTIELGTGWRIPTKTEWTNADAGWSSYTDTYNSVLKLHAAGYLRNSDGRLRSRGSIGSYWSSTQSGTLGWYLHFDSGVSVISNNSKAYGYSVRCLRD